MWAFFTPDIFRELLTRFYCTDNIEREKSIEWGFSTLIDRARYCFDSALISIVINFSDGLRLQIIYLRNKDSY
jgi:hypothetical protein